MHLGDLAAELQLRILQFCPSSRDLSTLSRTHTSLRYAVKYMLYSNIGFCALPMGKLIGDTPRTCQSLTTLKTSLLHTLSTNARKAAMLSEALQYLPHLVDLCIVYNCKGCLNQMIRSNNFQLHALYLPAHVYIEDLNLEGVIANQPRLRLLEIHCGEDNAERIEPLFESSSGRPRIAMADYVAFISSSWRSAPGMPKDSNLAKQVSQGPLRGPYLIQTAWDYRGNISLLDELMEATVTCLKNYGRCCVYMNISIYDTTIQKLWRSPGFIKRLALFGTVRELSFSFLDLELEEIQSLSKDLELNMVGNLEDEWRGIREIRIYNECPRCVFTFCHGQKWRNGWRHTDSEDDTDNSGIQNNHVTHVQL